MSHHARITSIVLLTTVPLAAGFLLTGCDSGDEEETRYEALGLAGESVLGGDAVEEALTGVQRQFNQPGLLAGDLVMEKGVGVFVPPQGEEVTLFVERDDGDSEDVVVTHAPDGRVSVTRHLMDKTPLLAPEAGAAVAAVPSACSDTAYSFIGGRWTVPYLWWFRAATTPTGITQGMSEWTLQFAANNITQSYNDCGLTDLVSAANEYRGRTGTSPNITSNTTVYACGTSDRWSVVDFGTLPKGVLAVTCLWSSAGVNRTADVRINRNFYKWFTGGAVPAGCKDRFGIEDVMTHEFGHAFGLGHVAEKTHGRLTMSTQLPSCTRANTTLGRGDVLGLRAKY